MLLQHHDMEKKITTYELNNFLHDYIHGRTEWTFNLTYNEKNPQIIIISYIIDAFKVHNNLK